MARHLFTVGTALLLVGMSIGAVGAPAAAHADDLWVAVAASQTSGEEGVDTGFTRQSALINATRGCNRLGGVVDCQPLAAGPEGCVAAATMGTPYSIRGAWAPTREAAAQAALAQAAPGSRVIVDCLGDPGLPAHRDASGALVPGV
ncbi:DUF4189 domain-containing protein [Mycolicibacterium sp. HS_4_1]